MSIIPGTKSDIEACERLKLASDDDVCLVLEELLEWIQDYNWPVAPLVVERIIKLKSVEDRHLLKVLSGTDDMWKYWLISKVISQLPLVSNDIVNKLSDIADFPTPGEYDESVDEAARKVVESV